MRFIAEHSQEATVVIGAHYVGACRDDWMRVPSAASASYALRPNVLLWRRLRSA